MEYIENVNLAEKILNILTEKIIRGELKAGDRIFEAKMAKELGVSQSPLREALRMLEKSGLVESFPRRGTIVTELTESYVSWLYDIITELYTLLAKRAAEINSEEALIKTVRVLKKLEDLSKTTDVDGYYNAIFEYATNAVEIVNSPLMNKILADLWPSKKRIEYLTISYRKNELGKCTPFFTKMLDAVNKMDMPTLVQVTRDFIQNEKNIAIEVLRNQQ